MARAKKQLAVVSVDPPVVKEVPWWEESSNLRTQQRYNWNDHLERIGDTAPEMHLCERFLRIAYDKSWGLDDFLSEVVDLLRDEDKDDAAEHIRQFGVDDYVLVDKDDMNEGLDKLKDLNDELERVTKDISSDLEDRVVSDETNDPVAILEDVLMLEKDIRSEIKDSTSKMGELIEKLWKACNQEKS